jgi:hypothetical protein
MVLILLKSPGIPESQDFSWISILLIPVQGSNPCADLEHSSVGTVSLAGRNLYRSCPDFYIIY